VKFFSRKTTDNCIVCAIDGHKCRVHHFYRGSEILTQLAADEFGYVDLQDLEVKIYTWCKQKGIKNTPCRWLLSRDLYRTYNVEAPNVLEKEMPQAIKWQIKDLLEYPVDDVLVSHYQPKHPDPQNKQIIAVAVEKKLIESLIAISQAAGLEMNAIEIEELTIGQALLPHLSEGKLVGFVGEDKTGLVFSFYSGDKLAFTRHKKGQFMPSAHSQEFSLDSDRESQEEGFLLETQRTLDYVVSQLFRKPVDIILLQENASTGETDIEGSDIEGTDTRNGGQSSLAETVHQLTETQVISVLPKISVSPENRSSEQELIPPNLAEIGSALRVEV